MSKQVKKVCKHEPGKDWTDGCCSSNHVDDTSSRKPDEQVTKFAFEQSFSAVSLKPEKSASLITN